jgi:hypothetical protein
MYDAQGDLNEAVTGSDLLLGTRQRISPFNYGLVVVGNKIQCLQPTLTSVDANDSLDPNTIVADSNLLWPAVIDMYGTLRPGVSQLRLEQENGTEVIGTIALDPSDDRFVIFDPDVDTLPQNTLDPVNAVINPLTAGPGEGLPAAAAGQRYLILDDMGGATAAWGSFAGAEANDIIQYDGTRWFVAFESAAQTTNVEFVTNITTGLQYRWTGEQWVKSFEGLYPGGEWSLVL